MTQMIKFSREMTKISPLFQMKSTTMNKIVLCDSVDVSHLRWLLQSMDFKNLGNCNNRWTCSLFMELVKEPPLMQCTRNETLVQSLMLTAHTKYENKLNFHVCFSQWILKVNKVSNVVSLLLVLTQSLQSMTINEAFCRCKMLFFHIYYMCKRSSQN